MLLYVEKPFKQEQAYIFPVICRMNDDEDFAKKTRVTSVYPRRKNKESNDPLKCGIFNWEAFMFLFETEEQNTAENRRDMAMNFIELLNEIGDDKDYYTYNTKFTFERDVTPHDLPYVSSLLLDDDTISVMEKIYPLHANCREALANDMTIVKKLFGERSDGRQKVLG